MKKNGAGSVACRPRPSSLVALAVLTVATGLPAAASTVTTPTAAADRPLGPSWLYEVPGPSEDALALDAEIYARDFGVSFENALARLRLQGTIADMDSAIRGQFGPAITYVRVIHQPEFSVTVGVHGDARGVTAFIDGAFAAEGLSRGIVRVVTTPYSASELDDVARELTNRLADLSGVNALVIRYDAGVVELRAENGALAASLLHESKGLPLPKERYTILVGAPDDYGPQANVYAGLPGNGCTRAFSVKNAAGTKGVLTAAHCNDNQDNIAAGIDLEYVAGYETGNTDAQWNKAAAGASVTFRNWAKDISTDSTTPGYRTITSAATSYTLGLVVCAYKVTTGYDCGTIESVAYDPDGVLPKHSASFVEVEPTISGNDLSDPGDSGAGWWNVNRAYGIHWGPGLFEPHNGVFGKISVATANLGVTVLTS